MSLLTAAVKSDNSVLASSRAILAAVQVPDATLEPLVNLIDIEVATALLVIYSQLRLISGLLRDRQNSSG